jgi:hypothetical protein
MGGHPPGGPRRVSHDVFESCRELESHFRSQITYKYRRFSCVREMLEKEGIHLFPRSSTWQVRDTDPDRRIETQVVASNLVPRSSCGATQAATIDRAKCRPQLGRERATLKMNEHDAIALLGIDSDEPELGSAFYPVAHRRDFAVAGQDCNRTVDSNLFIRQLY